MGSRKFGYCFFLKKCYSVRGMVKEGKLHPLTVLLFTNMNNMVGKEYTEHENL